MEDSIKHSGWLDYINSLNAAIRENQEEKDQGFFRMTDPSFKLDSESMSIFNDYLCEQSERGVMIDEQTLNDFAMKYESEQSSVKPTPPTINGDEESNQPKRRETKAQRKEKSSEGSEKSSDKIKAPRLRKKPASKVDTKDDKIKEENKKRAQKSRDRKKRYTEDLEEKVSILEKQVKYLTLELDRYKKIFLKQQVSKNEHNKSIEEEKNVLEGILNILQSSANMNKFTKLHADLTTKDGPKGDKRLGTLDKAFDVIIDFLIPDTYAFTFYLLELKGNQGDYIDSERLKKIRNFSKYQIQEMKDKNEIDEGDIHWHSLQITEEQAEQMNKHDNILKEGKQVWRDIIKRVNQLRNDVKGNGSFLSTYPPMIIPILTRDQLIKGYEGVGKFKAADKYTLEHLFGFEKRHLDEYSPSRRGENSSASTATCVLDKYIIDEDN